MEIKHLGRKQKHHEQSQKTNYKRVVGGRLILEILRQMAIPLVYKIFLQINFKKTENTTQKQRI